MSVKGYTAALGTSSTTPQSLPISGREAEQHKNDAGGFVFAADDWTQLDRWLVLGSEGGSYYANEKDATITAVGSLKRIVALGDAESGDRLIARIAEISRSGRALKNTPCILALAYVSKKHPREDVRKGANIVMPLVCRTGTDLFAFTEFVETFGGWGRGSRGAVAKWYERESDSVAYQLVKYRQRNGWAHRDLLRLSHPRASALLAWAAGKSDGTDGLPRIIEGFERAQKAGTPRESATLIREYNLPRECVNTDHLNDPLVWEALLESMPMTAMIRNLGNMTKCGLLVPMSNAAKTVGERLRDRDRLKRARIHPFSVLLALKTYSSGQGFRGKGSWSPVQRVVDALDDAFYGSIEFVEPTGKKTLLAIDVSGSMGSTISDTNITTSEAAAAMALITAKVERDNHVIIGFHSAGYNGYGYGRSAATNSGLEDLRISPDMRLDTVVKNMRLPGGGTDCSLPMQFAMSQYSAMQFDAIAIFTDNQTWAGNSHPAQAMAEYRRKHNPAARLATAAMTATKHSIVDSTDPLAMTCVGLDANVPVVMADFFAGKL